MFNFSRRINGRTYYTAYLFLLLVVATLLSMSKLLVGYFGEESDAGSIVGFVFFLTIMLFVIVYSAALIRQRANDISGKHPLLVFGVLYFTPIFLLAGFIPGEKTSNRFGDMPKRKVELS